MISFLLPGNRFVTNTLILLRLAVSENSHEIDGGVPNALGFDLEHWYTATMVREAVENPADHLEESVTIVLDLLAEYDTRATFFVVGEIAESHPELLRRIDAAGHELGSHSHRHVPVFDLTPEEFRAEVQQSREAIREATGVEVAGYRAPNFSVNRRNKWVFDVLARTGYRYDSSVFPARTPMYGDSSAPTDPYRVVRSDPFRRPREDETPSDLIEFPPTVLDPGVRLPLAGGFYARLLPERVLTRAVAALDRRDRVVNFYLHPWELNPNVPRVDLPAHERFVTYHGVDGMASKLATLLDRFDWAPLAEVLGLDESAPTTDREPLRPNT